MKFYYPPIQKARKPTRPGQTRTYNRLFALSNTMARAVSLDLFRGLRSFKSRVNENQVNQAWMSRDYSKIMAAVPWENLPEYLEPSAKKIQSGMSKAAQFNIEKLPKNARTGLNFSMNNPRIRQYVGRRTGELVVNIQRDTQRVIQNAVARSFNEALTPREVAGLIRGSIGLYPQQETALHNFRKGLVANGTIPEDRIDSMVDAYENRLLNQRARMIARTETRLATNVGQQSVWEQAKDSGFLPADATRVWIVDANPCEICAPMEGVEVGLNEPWRLSTGELVMVPSESHPNCMCGMELKLGYNDSTGGGDDSDGSD